METKAKDLMTTTNVIVMANQNGINKCDLPLAIVIDGFFVKPVNEDELVKVRYDEIMWIEAEKSYTHFHLVSNKTVTITVNIGRVEDVLPSRTFVRVSRSEIVNIHLVDGIKGRTLRIHGRRTQISAKYYTYVMSCLPYLI